MEFQSPKQKELESLELLYAKMREEQASNIADIEEKIKRLREEVGTSNNGKQLLQG